MKEKRGEMQFDIEDVCYGYFLNEKYKLIKKKKIISIN